MGRRCHIPARGEKGAADRSYGVQVAKLAGLPSAWLNARALFWMHWNRANAKEQPRPRPSLTILPLFAATPTQTAPVASEPNELEQMLNEILPDELTPREALQKLYELKEALK